MKKVTIILLSLLMFMFFTETAVSLDGFIYKEIVLDEDGEVVPGETGLDVEVKVSLYEGDSQVYEEYHDVTWDDDDHDQFGHFYIIVGDGYNSDGNFNRVDMTAETFIKIETSTDGGTTWVLSSIRALAEVMRSSINDVYWVLFSDGVKIKNDDGGHGDAKNSIDRAKKVVKSNANFNRIGKMFTTKGLMLESPVADFDASKSNVFVYTGAEAVLNVINPTAGQIVYISKSEGEGVLNFAGVGIANGETYSFLYTGRGWSRIK